MKDQTKKVASLKHKEQVEKSRNARLMEEARKREDNLSESSQQVKVRLVSELLGLECSLQEMHPVTSRRRLTKQNLRWCEGHSASEIRAH